MMYLEDEGVIYVFAEYEEKTKGIRTIPVLALART